MVLLLARKKSIRVIMSSVVIQLWFLQFLFLQQKAMQKWSDHKVWECFFFNTDYLVIPDLEVIVEWQRKQLNWERIADYLSQGQNKIPKNFDELIQERKQSQL